MQVFSSRDRHQLPVAGGFSKLRSMSFPPASVQGGKITAQISRTKKDAYSSSGDIRIEPGMKMQKCN
jgi:hypothetical protein